MRNPLPSPFKRSTLLVFSALASLTAFLGPSLTRAEELPNVNDSDLAHSIYAKGPSRIPGLTWSLTEEGLPNFAIEALKNGKPGVRMNGRFRGRNAGTLLFSSDGIQRAQYLDDKGTFQVLVPLTDRKTDIRIQYIDDYGNLKSQTVQVVYEGFHQFQLNQATKKRFTFDAGASISYLSYSQTAEGTAVKISEIGVTPKVGFTWNLSKRLDLGASTFVTAVPIGLSQTPSDISIPRFYGVNLRVGYKVYSLKTGNIYLMTGPYFWGMIVPPSPSGLNYGVVKLSGPQLFVVGRFLTGSGRTAVGYVKAATILDSGSGGFTENRELAIGGAYQITPATHKRKFMMNLDFASASFLVFDETIKLTSLSLGISTSF